MGILHPLDVDLEEPPPTLCVCVLKFLKSTKAHDLNLFFREILKGFDLNHGTSLRGRPDILIIDNKIKR